MLIASSLYKNCIYNCYVVIVQFSKYINCKQMSIHLHQNFNQSLTESKQSRNFSAILNIIGGQIFKERFKGINVINLQYRRDHGKQKHIVIKEWWRAVLLLCSLFR